ncbi:lipoprotein insertase outer membrane protein LolB [Chitiniphilus shinanonensis]|uniref:lipoprotein insertase outer membrane protein LolB n=1 Tax=Chitiniphilus shinanonensis TaxID=553088 RepID=UPI00304FA4FF
MAAAGAALWLVGCASVAPQPGGAVAHDFAADGRLLARGEVDGRQVNENANFRWRRSGETVTVELGSPLGETRARLVATPQEASIRMADGREAHATDADELLTELTGLTLPVSQLRWWIEGQPAPTLPVKELPAESSSTRSIEQAGWQVSFYDAAPYPKRLVLKHESLEVRVAVSDWP